MELAEEVVFIPGQEQIGDEGGGGDTHGNADALADEVTSEGDVGGGDEEAENFQELGDGEDAGGGVGGRAVRVRTIIDASIMMSAHHQLIRICPDISCCPLSAAMRRPALIHAGSSMICSAPLLSPEHSWGA